MEFDQTQAQQVNQEPAAPINANIQAAPPAPANKKNGWRIFWRIILVFSILANMFLFFALIALLAMFTIGSQNDYYTEQIIIKGSAAHKIAVIRLEGIIDGQVSDSVISQLQTAEEDSKVRAVIIRTVTPGGGVAASDQIHYEIGKFRRQTNKPVVAFMQTVAASGGYYTSVACDKIVAEPTVITGSIGVIMSHLVVKDLLENKLGINPVVIKSGQKKDWPSIFAETTDEQKQYLLEKLISPAYDRFVSLVTQGRPELTEAQVRELADGSIYTAPEAKEKHLIDEVGYIDTAVEIAKNLAGIKDAVVIEYVKPFSLSSLLYSQKSQSPAIDRNILHRLAVPELLYLWDAR